MPKTHRQSRTRVWWVWCALKQRCQNPRSKDFASYGGRGIRVCERWQRFENFTADMGPRPPGCMVERLDNDGPYSPENCVWATPTQQARNRRKRSIGTYSRGEANGWAKLTYAIVHEIRSRHSAGESFGSLARAFGVARMTVTRAIRGESWRGGP